MANVTLWGATYSNVPAITVPSVGGTVTFYEVSGTYAITQNGNYRVPGYEYVDVNVSGGGGASNFVTGTFVAGTSDSAHSVTIPYTGSGYPLMAVVVVDEGMYNSAIVDWYSTIQRYAVGEWAMTKATFDTVPTYTTSGGQNYGVTNAIYKSNTSSATTYTSARATTANIFSSSNATASNSTCCRFKNATTLSYFTASTSYGLMAGITYRYFIVYSS